jgi:hypothetical protein
MVKESSAASAVADKEEKKKIKKTKNGDAKGTKKAKTSKKSTKKNSDGEAPTRKRASESSSDAHGSAAGGAAAAANGNGASSSDADGAQPAAGKKRKTDDSSDDTLSLKQADADDGAVTLDRLPAAIAERLRAKGITELFPIQQASYGPVKAGRDVVAQARTGCVRFTRASARTHTTLTHSHTHSRTHAELHMHTWAEARISSFTCCLVWLVCALKTQHSLTTLLCCCFVVGLNAGLAKHSTHLPHCCAVALSSV